MVSAIKYPVMLSSTFKELEQHRLEVRDALLSQGFFPVAMENDAAVPDHDLISASLAKVDEAEAYVGLISYRYGTPVDDADRNPQQLSLTELEYRRAKDRSLPICMFIMHDEHLIPRRATDEETDGTKQKLKEFISRVKKECIYAEFKSIENLKVLVTQSLANLRTAIESRGTSIIRPSEGAVTSDLPSGWEVVDCEKLVKIRDNAPPVDLVIKFFDGILPTWRLALAHGVESREVVERLANRLRAAHDDAAKPMVTLLVGAGGEGKSTALLQAAAALIEDKGQCWTCVHRLASNADLPVNMLSKLPFKPEHAWVVVADDADNIAEQILEAVKAAAARTDIHLLLAARDAEWQLTQLFPRMWQPHADFHSELLTGLTETDARRIVRSWKAWGDDAMGKLKGQSEDHATAALLGHARDLATRKEDGELLGALLVTRKGEDMRAHVRTLVNGLGHTEVINKHSLRDVYAYVAVMHAENQLYLSGSVLSFALGCGIDELEVKGLHPLRREAMLDSGDVFVLTRHRRIAEAAVAVLREDDVSIDNRILFLARAALENFHSGRDTPRLVDWRYALARHLAQKDSHHGELASAIAKTVWQLDRDEQSLTAYSSILRDIRRVRDAMSLLRSVGEQFSTNRDVLSEWGTVAGGIGDQGLSAWLNGKALADGDAELDRRRCEISLTTIGLAFLELHRQTGEQVYAIGQAACGQLGLKLKEISSKSRKYLKKHRADGERNGIGKLASKVAIGALREAVIYGAAETKKTNDPAFFEKLLGNPDSYHFTGLEYVINNTMAPKAANLFYRATVKHGLKRRRFVPR